MMMKALVALVALFGLAIAQQQPEVSSAASSNRLRGQVSEAVSMPSPPTNPMEKLPSDLVEIEPDASSNLLESEAAEAFEKGMVCVRVGTTSRGCRSCCPSRCTYDSRPYGSYDRCCCGY